MYARGKKTHTASRPGEAPANDTGNLQRSITVSGIKSTGNTTWTATVEANTPYARALEFGTLDGSIEPRPFLVPAFNELRDEIAADIRDEIAKATSKV